MRYGFVGLGHLGKHLAANLARAGFTLDVHDLDRPSADLVLAAGARVGLAKMFRLDAIERVNAVGGGPRCEKRVFGGEGTGHCWIIPNERAHGI